MTKGDIIYGRKNSDAIHPIIYLKDRDADLFFGAMIKTAENYKDSILMSAEHFKTEDADGAKFELQF